MALSLTKGAKLVDVGDPLGAGGRVRSRPTSPPSCSPRRRPRCSPRRRDQTRIETDLVLAVAVVAAAMVAVATIAFTHYRSAISVEKRIESLGTGECLVSGS